MLTRLIDFVAVTTIVASTTVGVWVIPIDSADGQTSAVEASAPEVTPESREIVAVEEDVERTRMDSIEKNINLALALLHQYEEAGR